MALQYLFSAPLFFLDSSNVCGPYWQSNLVRRGSLGRLFLLPGSCVCLSLCAGQFIHRSGVVMNPDWRVLPSLVDNDRGCPGGKQHSGTTELCLALRDCSPSPSLDRSV